MLKCETTTPTKDDIRRVMSYVGTLARGKPKRQSELTLERNRKAGRKSAWLRHLQAQIRRRALGLAPLPPLQHNVWGLSPNEVEELAIESVIVRKGEPVDRALKRLKNKEAGDILEQVRRLQAFETPSQNQSIEESVKKVAKHGRMKFRFSA